MSLPSISTFLQLGRSPKALEKGHSEPLINEFTKLIDESEKEQPLKYKVNGHKVKKNKTSEIDNTLQELLKGFEKIFLRDSPRENSNFLQKLQKKSHPEIAIKELLSKTIQKIPNGKNYGKENMATCLMEKMRKISFENLNSYKDFISPLKDKVVNIEKDSKLNCYTIVDLWFGFTLALDNILTEKEEELERIEKEKLEIERSILQQERVRKEFIQKLHTSPLLIFSNQFKNPLSDHETKEVIGYLTEYTKKSRRDETIIFMEHVLEYHQLWEEKERITNEMHKYPLSPREDLFKINLNYVQTKLKERAKEIIIHLSDLNTNLNNEIKEKNLTVDTFDSLYGELLMMMSSNFNNENLNAKIKEEKKWIEIMLKLTG